MAAAEENDEILPQDSDGKRPSRAAFEKRDGGFDRNPHVDTPLRRDTQTAGQTICKEKSSIRHNNNGEFDPGSG